MKMTVNGYCIDLTVDEFIELNAKMKGVVEEKPEEAADELVEVAPGVLELVDDPYYIGTGELASVLGVGVSTIANLRNYGMPCVETKSVVGTHMFKYDKDICVEWYKKYKKEHPTRGGFGPAAKVINKPKAVVKFEDGYLGTSEMAEYLGCGISTMFLLRKAGMPCIETRSGNNQTKTFKYNKDECARWYEQYKKSVAEKKASRTIPFDEDGYLLWKGKLFDMCRNSGKDVGKMLGIVYKYMTKNYGIVWEQEAKDFYKANGERPHTTLQLAYWIELQKSVYKNLVSSCLDTVLKEEKV